VVQQSSRIQSGSYEEESIQKRNILMRYFKIGFLSFVGPLYLVLFEIIQLLKAGCLLLGIFGGPSLTDKIEGIFDSIF
jgi:hypothetical protein